MNELYRETGRLTTQLNWLKKSEPTLQRYMREMSILGITPSPNTSQPTPEHKIYPYWLR